MEIRYDQPLMESVVLLEIQRRERAGDLTFSKAFHSLADRVYEIESAEERDSAFRNIYHKFFLKWRLGSILDKTLREFPLLEDTVDFTYFKMASCREDAGADLMVKKGGEGPKVIFVQLLSQFFMEDTILQNFLRHEFMHISDILDEAFQYEEGLILGAIPNNWIRDRYRLLWDIYIDSRLSNQSNNMAKEREKRRGEFNALYQKIPEKQRGTIFEVLWNAKGLTHKEILEMAQDTINLFKMAGIGYVEDTHQNKKINLPGMPCPLCRFPTYYWEEDLLSNPEESLLKSIQVNHPEWTPEDGACSRCIERYQIIAEIEERKDGTIKVML